MEGKKPGRNLKATGKSEQHLENRKLLENMETTGKPGRYREANKPIGQQIVTWKTGRYMKAKKPVGNQEGMQKFVGHWETRKPLGSQETNGRTLEPKKSMGNLKTTGSQKKTEIRLKHLLMHALQSTKLIFIKRKGL